MIGDAASFSQEGSVLPGVAQVAIQQGKYVANVIKKNIPFGARSPFHYKDRGNLATIGTARAVMQRGNFKLNGLLAWLLWGAVHIMYLISYRNRYKVMAEWLWMYLTQKQAIRLITHKPVEK